MDDNYQRKVSMFMRAAVRLVAMLVSALMPLVAQIHLLSPSAGQVLFPGRLVRIEWDNATQGPVDVLYSTDRGRSWVTIASAVSVHGIEWTVPLLDTVPIFIKVQATASLPPSQFGSVTVPDSVRSAWWVGTAKTVASLSIGGFVCFSNDEQRFDRRCLPIGIEDAKLLCLYPNAPDSVIVARGSELMVISLREGTVAATIKGNQASDIVSIAAHPQLPIIAAGYADGYVRLWNITARQMIGSVLSQALGSVTAVAFHPHGDLVAHAGADGVIIVEPWIALGSSTERIYLRQATELTSIEPVTTLAFAPTGKFLASAGKGRTVRIWDFANWRVEHTIADVEGIPSALAWSGDGSRLFAGDQAGKLYQWSVVSGDQLHLPLSFGGGIIAIGSHPLNDTAFVATAEGKIAFLAVQRVPIATDSTIVLVRYPFGLQLGRCRGIVGDTVHLPILLDRQYNVPHFAHATFAAYCWIELPPSVAVVGDRSLYADSPRRSMYDTIRVPLYFGVSDTVALIPLRLLAASPSQEEVRLLLPSGIVWERAIGSFILERVENGEIIVDTICQTQSRRIPTFTEDIVPYVAPNPASDECVLVFSAVETGEYRIELHSIARADAQIVFSGTLVRGVHRLPLTVSAFASGAYRMVVRGPSQERTISLLIVR